MKKNDLPPSASELDLILYREHLRVSTAEDQTLLFDPIRRKLVSATPEELVRQLAILFLKDHYALGRGRIAVERALTTGLRDRRFDLVILQRSGDPWMLVECKAPGIRLDGSVWQQASMYNRTIQAPYIWLTNGHSQRLGHWVHAEARLKEIPLFPGHPDE